MDYRHTYAGDKIWKYTKGLNLKLLKQDLTGENREEMFGRTRPRRESGYLLPPEKIKEVQKRYRNIDIKNYSKIGGIYGILLLGSFRSNLGLVSKIVLPNLLGAWVYKYFMRQQAEEVDNLTKEMYFKVEKPYREFRYSGDIRDLGEHIDVLEWSEIK